MLIDSFNFSKNHGNIIVFLYNWMFCSCFTYNCNHPLLLTGNCYQGEHSLISWIMNESWNNVGGVRLQKGI